MKRPDPKNQELSEPLRQAVDAVNSQPEPTGARDKALAKAAQLAKAPRVKPWYRRYPIAVAVAALVLVGLTLTWLLPPRETEGTAEKIALLLNRNDGRPDNFHNWTVGMRGSIPRGPDAVREEPALERMAFLGLAQPRILITDDDAPADRMQLEKHDVDRVAVFKSVGVKQYSAEPSGQGGGFGGGSFSGGSFSGGTGGGIAGIGGGFGGGGFGGGNAAKPDATHSMERTARKPPRLACSERLPPTGVG